MAYQEDSTVASPAEVINALMTFCAANGWTVERNNLAGGNRTATLRKAGVTDYIHVYNTDNVNIRLRISVGYDAGAVPSAQPNVSDETRTYLYPGAYPKTFFFASQDQVWVVVAIAANAEYRHFTFGRLDKAGEYTGGTYIEGTVWPMSSWSATWTANVWPFASEYQNNNSNGRIRADIPDDGRTNFFFSIGGPDIFPNPVTHARGEMGEVGTASRLSINAAQNSFSGRTILHTITILLSRTGSQLYYSPAGTVQDVRICSIRDFEPEQEISVGSDTWKVFPLVAKRPMNPFTSPQPAASGDFAFAIKKVA